MSPEDVGYTAGYWLGYHIWPLALIMSVLIAAVIIGEIRYRRRRS